jgi:hypothetical protein
MPSFTALSNLVAVAVFIVLHSQIYPSIAFVRHYGHRRNLMLMANDQQKNDLTASVRRCLLSKDNLVAPFVFESFGDGICIDKDISFSTDILKGSGREEYVSMTSNWFTTCMAELSDAQCSVNRLSIVDRNLVRLQWNVTFVPDSLTSLAWFGKTFPGLRVSYFNVLDKERQRSQFSWEALKMFFGRIITSGEVRLPHAVIVGTTDLFFSDDNIAPPAADNTLLSPERPRWRLVALKEKLNLVKSIDSGILKNRKLATDLLEFIDARRPPSIGLNEWNDIIVSRINTRSVPGMGQFDIDGLEAERQTELVSASNRILGWATAVVLLFGVMSATVVFDKIFLYQERISQMQDFQ